jgi:hypothetical protein
LGLEGGGWFVFSAFSSCSRHRRRRSVNYQPQGILKVLEGDRVDISNIIYMLGFFVTQKNRKSLSCRRKENQKNK